ncbi:MAG TPA: hypothetical protein VF062_16600 [Candidatus Limnocylindrales bacterium]
MRESLRRNAGRAPRGDRMLSWVRLESRRRKRRRDVAMAAVTATVLLGGVVGASSLTARPAVGPQIETLEVLQPGGPTRTSISFPFTPQRALAGSASPVLILSAGKLTLTYDGTDAADATVTVGGTPPQAGGTPPQVGGTPPQVAGTPPQAGTPVAVSVRGHAGSHSLLRPPSSPPLRVLSWQERPDMWVEIRAPQSETLEDLTAYALALRAESMTQPLPFEFDLVPAALTMDNANPSAVTFAPPGVPAIDGFTDRVAVMLEVAGKVPVNGRPVAVQGRDGWLSETDGATMLRVDNRDGRVLTIQVDHDIHLSEADLLRFAAGVHVTGHGQSAKG